MAQPQIFRGTWDEIAAHAETLRHYPHLTLIVTQTEATVENKQALDLTPEERIRALDALAEKHRALPVLPPEAFERESLYEESL